MKRVGTTHFTNGFRAVFPLWRRIVREGRENRLQRGKMRGRKRPKSGGSDPTFRPVSRPKSFLGSLPPWARTPCRRFFAAQENLKFGS